MKIFKEEQRFTQTWLMVLLAISFLMVSGLIINNYSKDSNNMSTKELIFTLLFMLLAIVPLFFFKLKTRIDNFGIHFQFFPFHLKTRTISWSEVNTINTRNYDAITEFGGWGCKGGLFWKKSAGIAYNVAGDQGIQLLLKNGKKILIGTQKKQDVVATLHNYKHKIISNEI